MQEGDKGGVDRVYLTFDYISLSDFLFAHIVTPPHSMGCSGQSPAKKLESPAQNVKKLDKKLRLRN